jgi:para-nitrobenzyl esterase
MRAAFASFARTGNPNHAELPNWPAFNLRTYPTMVFANECKVVKDPNCEERLALKAIRELGNTTRTAQ